MSLLTLIQDVCNQVGLPTPSAVVSSQTLTYKQLLSLLHTDAANELKSSVRWPELTRTHTITLVADQEAYELPADLERQVSNTHWDQSNDWPLVGPMSPQTHNSFLYGVSGPQLRTSFRIKGFADNQVHLYPTPSASDAGNILSFEYQSRNWCRPATWVENTSYMAGSYTFYNGNYYYSAGGGTTGTTAPTHTSGAVVDGTVSWAYYSGTYERCLKDTDEMIIAEYICALALKYLWCQSKGLPFKAHYERFQMELRRQHTKKRGTQVLSLVNRRRKNYPNVPTSSWSSS